LTAQELKTNSKWIISGESTPIVDLRSEVTEAESSEGD
jgi:hypothetical protein